ncbi:hypothetical protein BCR26_14315 [Enterococcus rivorum]|uniref:Transposase n=1 Tax=Enterococcus rivorum TaxID=762845 RepID=A0A1E5KWJ0_9ENTE|nr:hypothetical protein BCR26_14315 [Enterococcus rivorum]
MDQAFVSAVASKRNHIPRKSLNYKTPLEVFMKLLNATEKGAIGWFKKGPKNYFSQFRVTSYEVIIC